MDAGASRCKSCGIVFQDLEHELDKCAKKRIYCELCLAQKNPVSGTEQKIKRKYGWITAVTAFIILALLFGVHWGENKNDSIFEYLIALGLGYVLVWIVTAVLLLPVLRFLKKPHKKQIESEKEKYIEQLEVKKKKRKTRPDH